MSGSVRSLMRRARQTLGQQTTNLPTGHRHRYRDDPLGYCRNVLYGVPWSKQLEILELFQQPPYKVLVRSGHNVGKSWLGAAAVAWSHECRTGLTLVTAPTSKSLKDIIFSEVRKLRPQLPGLAPADTWAKVKAGHELLGFTAKKGEAFAGRHAEYLGLLFDEATGIAPVFFEVAKGMFTGAKGHWWLCCYNPTDPTSQVYHEECSNDWHLVTISQLDHPNIVAELRGEPPPYPAAVRLSQVIAQLDDYSSRLAPDSPDVPDQIQIGKVRWLPSSLIDIRVLGRWSRSGGNTVWNEILWERLLSSIHDLNPAWKVQIGCDVARYGYDDTCLFVKQGPCVLHCERHNGWGTNKTAARLKELCWQFRGPHEPKAVPCLIDGIGVGGGVVDQHEGFAFIDVQSSRQSSQPQKYYNLRSELWFTPTEHAAAGLLDISRLHSSDQTRLKTELLAVKYDLDSADRQRVESKLATRGILKRSPDLADGFNLACYWVHE